eukprot:4866751-Amphidinium_carterae.1
MSGASSHEAPNPVSQWAAALAAVQKDWRALARLPQELNADRAIVLAAVQQHGYALEDAAEKHKGDHAIVLAAVQQHGGAI